MPLARGAVVEPAPATSDPDLDMQQEQPAPVEPVDEYQRLVANPFLTVLGWLVMFGVMRESLRRHNLWLFIISVALLVGSCLFLQFHCLDCGATGWLMGYRRHACPAVVARRSSQAQRRFRGPGLPTQLLAWFILLTAACGLGLIALQSR